MTEQADIRCRAAACLENLGDDKEWSVYLLNDGTRALSRVVLKTFGHEWGNFGDAVHPSVEVTDVSPGSHVLLWRDNDHELRMWLTLAVWVDDRETEWLVEFPMLYRSKDTLPLVESLGKPGWVVRIGDWG